MTTQVTTSTTTSLTSVANWYHAFFTGLLLYTSSRKGAELAADFSYRIFARQREQRFLPGLKKLGLDGLPHAVAAAQYHYLSNNMGGVPVQYMPESDRKAWIRYTPPRWIWSGTALCGIPPEVSTAMLRGWHAQNGLSLGNPRLGFVCTKQAVNGQAGLEGYYYEYDFDLNETQRLRLAYDEDAPDFDASKVPTLPTSTWPQARLDKAHRNYAMEYIRTALPVAVELFGVHESVTLFREAARMIGMQFYHATAAAFDAPQTPSAQGFAEFMHCLAQAQDDAVQIDSKPGALEVTQTGWKLFSEDQGVAPAVFQIWNGLLEGALMAHNHRLTLTVLDARCEAPYRFRWSIKPA